MIRTIAALAALAAAFALAWPIGSELFAAERCLEAGGSYDYAAAQCDFKASHPSPGLWQRHGVTLLEALALGWVGCALLLRSKK